ncbi:uncharacterized protein LOC143283243 [Babylonia areolata]|uniref:uncharacterized protein LOC143283243 n=1 Tax=Babylonia areolata TaxID=304850 RepID=UPI003FD1384D
MKDFSRFMSHFVLVRWREKVPEASSTATCPATMLPTHTVTRTKRTDNPTRSAARRLQDTEFNEAENKENSSSVQDSHHPPTGHHQQEQYKIAYTAKRTKQLVTHSEISRTLDFSANERLEKEQLDGVELYRAPKKKRSLTEAVSTVPSSLAVKLKSLRIDETDNVRLGGGGGGATWFVLDKVKKMRIGDVMNYSNLL